MKHDTTSEAISEATDAFESGMPIFWAMPLIDVLEERKRLSAIDWGISLLCGQMERCRGESGELEKGWLRELKQMLQSTLPAWEAIMGRSREVWASNPPLDLYQKAVADLFAALSELSRGSYGGYKKYVAMSVMKLPGVGEARDRDMFHKIISSFSQFVTSPTDDSVP